MKITIEDKIDIEDVVDDYTYEVVARLVDNEKVIFGIRSIRKRLNMTSLLSYEDAKKWLKNSQDGMKRSYLGLWLSMVKNKLNINDSFDSALKIAVLSNKITDNEYLSSAYCIEFPPDDMEMVTDYIPRIAILVSPETKVKEVEKLMQTEVKELFKELGIKSRSPVRVRQNTFRKSREWYWMSKKMSIPEICRLADIDAMNADDLISPETVETAIKRYKKKIS